MKKIIIFISIITFLDCAYTQTWDRIGNTVAQGEYLGSNNNQSLLFKTNNTNRMKLNGNINYNVDGYAGVRNGNLLLGWQNTGNLYNANFGAYSLLHLNGNGSIVFQAGYRNWMQTGITFTGNNDLSYIGLRQVGTGWDVTETTITWTDNPGPSSGPDDMEWD